MFRKYLKVFTICMSGALSSLILSCSNNPLAGSASQTGNGMVTGMVVSSSDEAKNGVVVTLRLHDYDPINISHPEKVFSRTTITNEKGLFKFDTVPADTYTIEGSSPVTGQKLLHFDVVIDKHDTTRLQPDTLKALGKIRLLLPDTLHTPSGYVFIPGTSFGGVIDTFATSRRYIEIDSVPAGQIPGIYYVVNSTLTLPKLLRDNFTVFAGETLPITLFDWYYSRMLVLNTTSSGADVSGIVTNFPVLIRLSAGTFNFSLAQSHGEDIRFTKTDGAALPYEIEHWDAVTGRAAVWVKVDTIYGNNSRQSITMYWGNPEATDMSASTAVFDTTNGFQGVWHLSDKAGNQAGDATVNGYFGISPDSASPQVAQGMIGNCRSFDGITQYITMPNTADGKLDFPQDGNYSVSVWVMADTLSDLQQSIVSKGRYQYFLWIDSTLWQFWEYQDRAGWETSGQPAISRQWVLLTGVRNGTAQYLYVNGERVDSVLLKSDFNLRNTGSDLILGRVHELGIIPTTAGLCSFKGKLDEVRIVSKAQSPDWVRLCYMNQRVDDRLIIFK
jgi:hypothetical protein